MYRPKSISVIRQDILYNSNISVKKSKLMSLLDMKTLRHETASKDQIEK